MGTMRPRQPHRDNWLLALSLVIVVGTAAIYALLISNWLSAPAPAPQSASPAADAAPAAPAAADVAALASARRALRESFLDPRSWLLLSDALAKAGRPVDAFYLTYGAREFFGDAVFLEAHAALKRKPTAAPAADEAALRARLKDQPDDAASAAALARLLADGGRPVQAQKVLDDALILRPDDASLLLAKAQVLSAPDPLAAIPLFARAAHADPSSDDAKTALRQLQDYASLSEEGAQGESARLGREALEELRKAHPADPNIFSALATAMLARGDRATAQALVAEAGRKARGGAVSRVEGQLALSAGDPDAAVSAFTEAFDKDPQDLVSAEKLVALYSQRGDEEAALPYEIALYRHDPQRLRGVVPLELAVRRALDARRSTVLRNVTVDSVGRYFDFDDASLRAEACARAARFKDPRWIDALAERLDDDAEIVRHNAEYALYQIAAANPDAVKARRDDWLQGDRPLVRARVLNLFADLWPNESMPLALKALDDPNPAVRYFAKTLVFDRYYRDIASAQRAEKQYLMHEKDPQVLAMYKRGTARS